MEQAEIPEAIPLPWLAIDLRIAIPAVLVCMAVAWSLA